MATAAPTARPRPGGGRLFIIVGVLLAVVAGAGVFFIGPLIGGGGGGSIAGGTQKVVVARQNISLRHQITPADVTTVDGAGSFVGVNAYQKTSDVVTLIAEVNIKAGAILTADMLASDKNLITNTSGSQFLPLASGYVAMTIPTGEQQGVAGHIQLGDYITIIASASVTIFSTTGAATGPPRFVSKTVFTQVRVIGVGPAQINVQPASGSSSSNPPATTGGVTSSLTIELTQCQSELMVWFLANTQLRYTLEASDDYLKTPPSSADTNCPFVTSAQGVSNVTVDKLYGFSKL